MQNIYEMVSNNELCTVSFGINIVVLNTNALTRIAVHVVYVQVSFDRARGKLPYIGR